MFASGCVPAGAFSDPQQLPCSRQSYSYTCLLVLPKIDRNKHPRLAPLGALLVQSLPADMTG